MTDLQVEYAMELIDVVSKSVKILDYLEATVPDRHEGLSWILQEMSTELDTARAGLEFAIRDEVETPTTSEVEEVA